MDWNQLEDGIATIHIMAQEYGRDMNIPPRLLIQMLRHLVSRMELIEANAEWEREVAMFQRKDATNIANYFDNEHRPPSVSVKKDATP